MLAKAASKAAHTTWQECWVWLLQDRLCYAVSGAEDRIRYIPLDRITVRPLPRGYTPRIAVMSSDEAMAVLPGRMERHSALGDSFGMIFSMQYGSKTAYWAAASSQEAKGWLRAIRHAWVAAVLKPDRFIRASLSLACCSTSQKGASQGTLSPSPADSRDPAVPKTILDVEVVTREAQGWGEGSCLWIVLHGQSPGESSGRHLLIPASRSAKPFGTAAIATCQVACPRAFAGSIRAIELGLHGKCRLWMAEKVRLRPKGQVDWTEYSCAGLLSTAS
ncbi:hypothetical protein CVIRNUC_000464 [Coccomyxa viridis]|uniref:PH domain-containing protein n=1 Tax=Coccomyxa viridis TaxID=1274662 RepID=A0AAV1HQI6_9CHLO|nr:hypothetical protein CVIRNUC_000464 [Coccomyxa viridis]